MKHGIANRLLAALLVGVLLSTLVAAEPAWPDDQPLWPSFCENWQTLREQLSASDDLLSRQLAEFHAEDAHQWCQERRRRVSEQRESSNQWRFDHAEWLAEIARIVSISLLLALLIWAIWRWRRQLAALLPRRSAAPTRPKASVQHSASSRADSLSREFDALARVEALWGEGKDREALALLYQWSLHEFLGQQRSLDSLTEREVLRALKKHGLEPTQLAWCQQLIDAWQVMAWGHRPVDQETFDQLVAGWRRLGHQSAQTGGVA